MIVNITEVVDNDRYFRGKICLRHECQVSCHISGFVQDCSISIAKALEIMQSCTKPSIERCNVQNTILDSKEGDPHISQSMYCSHDDVIKWKHFPRYWPFVRGIHRWPVNSPNKGQWCGALMFSSICAWINGWVNNREAGDLRRHRAHCDVPVMWNGRTLKSVAYCKTVVPLR